MKSRIGIVAVLVVALVGAGFTRQAAWALRTGQGGAPVVAPGGTSLSSMNSFALALLLGGLRGPLVMLLWTSSESQKTEKNLEDFDTKVEWIRLLQPEFDTVHIFQIWNKAYNISVQMANLPNKYATILDALEYARGVDTQRPQNINILHAIGGIYFDKLGNAAEKRYYRQRVRTETLPHTSRQKLSRGDAGWRPLEHDPVLDASGNILPEYLKPKFERPEGVADGATWDTGAELQHLERFQPFPYGVSPLALGYNYFKRSQILQDAPYNQRHAQLSDLVVDSRPALALRDWSEEERRRGRQVEIAVFDKPLPEEEFDWELPTADVPPVAPPDPGALREAIFSYDRAIVLANAAIEDYQRHLRTHTGNWTTYTQHMDHLRAMMSLNEADAAYLRAMTASPEERAKLLAGAREKYLEALRAAELMILRFYVDDDQARRTYPPGVDKSTIMNQPPEVWDRALANVLQTLNTLQFDQFEEDRGEYMRYVQRAASRIEQIEAQTRPNQPAATAPAATTPATATAPATP